MFPRRLFEHGVSGSSEQKKLPGYRGAINDALIDAGGETVEMPATAEKVWRALQGRG